jgi:hypothetical protein
VEIALLLVSMAAVVLAATATSDRLRVPAPLLLVAVGAAASYVPGVPTIHLESEVVLFGLLPPLLYAAAIQTSLVDFNANRGTILRLSIVLVLVSALAVAAVVEWLVPSLGWAAAIAIGRTPWRPRPSPAGSGCRGAWSPSSRASRCSTTPPRSSPFAPPSRRCPAVSRWPRSASTSSARPAAAC